MPVIRLNWIELFNFKSYRGKHRFEFPAGSGLYFLTGKNLVEPRLGANGIGKSTLLDAIFWACYGKTLRGLRGNEIISQGLNSSTVTLSLSIGDQVHEIKRVQSPNRLAVDKVIVANDFVEGLLRLTPDQFTYAIISPQFGTRFLDKSPTEKLDLFSNILGLEFWLDKSKEAQDEADRLSAELAQLEKDVAKLEGQYEALEAELPGLKVKLPDAVALNRIVAGFKAKLEGIEKKQQLTDEKWQKATKVRLLAKADVDKTTEAIENIGNLKGACPTCLQTVSAAHLKAEKARLLDHLTRLKTHQQRAVADFQAVGAEATQLNQDARAIRQNLDDFSRKQAEANLYAEMVRSKTAQMDALGVSITNADTKLDRLVVVKDSVQFWVAGFKRIRLFIIEQTLRQLELEVNNNLASLGLPDWQITFDVERENKSGGVTKGFVVFVQPPGSGEPVRLEAWSGGEYQRLRLAGDLGLANLIMERAGLVNSIEFYDEPSQHLSDEGLRDLADTLAERADDSQRTIFLVDHRIVDSSNFAGVITVIKDEGGSHLEAP